MNRDIRNQPMHWHALTHAHTSARNSHTHTLAVNKLRNILFVLLTIHPSSVVFWHHGLRRKFKPG